jgi:pimeloyl-ACP methyl ester carboxylesterase
MEVNLVGHSLGCRVILELLAQWTGGLPSNIRIDSIVLMAAAVAVKHVDDEGRLRPAAMLSRQTTIVLDSQGDRVLHWVFPLGETVVGEASFPTAVGRFGGPLNTWHIALPMATAVGKAYDHGSYWPGEEAASEVAVALGGVAVRKVRLNALVDNPSPPQRGLSARTTFSRVTPSRPRFT